jgi:membrane-bound ClpP family serine protease
VNEAYDLSMTAAGVVLLILGALLAASEAHNPTHGVAGSTGVAVMAVGIVLALVGAGAAVAIGVGAGVLLAAAGGAGVALTVTRAGAARRRRVRGGAQGLIGEIGTVRSWSQDDGSISLQGAVWHAQRSPAPEPEDGAPPPPLHAGDRVVVERLSGLTVSVRPAEEWELL